MLALWVMIFHLLSVPVIGGYAVFAFFILSGFLMTLIMHESYGYNISGFKKYALNRFLRLYPMYWAVAIVSIAIIFIVSEDYSILYKSSIRYPETLYELSSNALMIFPNLIPWTFEPRLSPPTWALTIELFFYLCIGLGLSKTKKITCIWLLVSVGYFVISYLFMLDGAHRYGTILAASLPFSLGSAAYHFRYEIYRLIQKFSVLSPVIVLILFIINGFVMSFISFIEVTNYKYFVEIGKYLNMMLATVCVVSFYFNSSSILINKKLDKFLGDFSYPIYLLHWQCGVLASYLLFDIPTRGFSSESMRSLGLALFITIALSYLFILLVDENVSKIRQRIKNKNI
jgi:peptidoglycan/LPS O-acetylase OafA/YrhL